MGGEWGKGVEGGLINLGGVVCGIRRPKDPGSRNGNKGLGKFQTFGPTAPDGPKPCMCKCMYVRMYNAGFPPFPNAIEVGRRAGVKWARLGSGMLLMLNRHCCTSPMCP